MPAPFPIAIAPAYRRHRPEQTALYAAVAEYYPNFVQEIERSAGQLSQFVRREFEDYLKCGLLEHGFLRVKCDSCRHEHLVAFSCKQRGFCPSCGARRIVESAAHLVDHVFPHAPVRQCVLIFPFPLRFLLAVRPQAFTAVLAVVQRSIASFVIRRSGLTVASGARTGAVTLIPCFGSALNLNVHLHMLFLDGAYQFHGSRVTFHRAHRPDNSELSALSVGASSGYWSGVVRRYARPGRAPIQATVPGWHALISTPARPLALRANRHAGLAGAGPQASPESRPLPQRW